MVEVQSVLTFLRVRHSFDLGVLVGFQPRRDGPRYPGYKQRGKLASLGRKLVAFIYFVPMGIRSASKEPYNSPESFKK